MHDTLDSMFGTTPEEPKNVIEQAAELLQGELIAEADAISVPAQVDTAVPAQVLPALPAVEDPHNRELQSDVDYAREQIKDLIDQSRLAIQGAMELAEAGDNPGAFRVVGELIHAATAANKELVNIHKIKKDAEKPIAGSGSQTDTGGGPVNIDKAVFIGRASDFLRELKKAKKALSDGA